MSITNYEVRFSELSCLAVMILAIDRESGKVYYGLTLWYPDFYGPKLRWGLLMIKLWR